MKGQNQTFGTITISNELDSDGTRLIRCDFQDMDIAEVFGMLEYAKYRAIREALEHPNG